MSTFGRDLVKHIQAAGTPDAIPYGWGIIAPAGEPERVTIAATHMLTTTDDFVYFGTLVETAANGDVSMLRIGQIIRGKFGAHKPVMITVRKPYVATLALTDRAVTYSE